MDAEGYLKSHGWRGLGYSLDLKNRGLQKPLLVSQKVDVLGVGKQKHQAQADQWWMRAFDESLKQIGTGQKTTLDSVRKNGVNRGGLYGFFVKGESLQGTLNDTLVPIMSAIPPTDALHPEKRLKKKRKHEDLADNGGEKRSRKTKSNQAQLVQQQPEAPIPSKSTLGSGSPLGLSSETLSGRTALQHDHTASMDFTENTIQPGSTADVGNALAVAADATFDFNADEISLNVGKKKRSKKIPGVGAVDRYPSKAEKRQKKLESQASAAGLSTEQYKEKLDEERLEREGPELQRVAEIQAARGGLSAKDYRKQKAQQREAAANAVYQATGVYPTPGTYNTDKNSLSNGANHQLKDMQPGELGVNGDTSAITRSETNLAPAEKHPEWHELSAKKRAQYSERAAQKGQTPEDYYAKRISKKSKLAITASVPDADEAPDTASHEGHVNSSTVADAPFVVDTIGDRTLSNANTSKTEVLRWHPDMLGNRKVKELSKAERLARKEWMQARRAARHAATGHDPTTKKERQKRRMEKKFQARDHLVAEILKKQGAKKNAPVGKDQLKMARRAAKRKLREEKKLKRNKMIHRK